MILSASQGLLEVILDYHGATIAVQCPACPLYESSRRFMLDSSKTNEALIGKAEGVSVTFPKRI